MTEPQQSALSDLDEDAALRVILEGTVTETGERFFYALVERLAAALEVDGAWVTEHMPEAQQLRALAFLMDDQWVENYVFDIAHTPCEAAITRKELVHFPDRLIDLFPDEPGIEESGFVSYMGIPLLDVDESIIGHMAVVQRRPMPEDPRVLALFRIFADRATAELRRLRAEAEIRQREEKLSRLVDSAMDAIIELDQQLQITRMNTAAEHVFGCSASDIEGRGFCDLLDEESHARLIGHIEELDARPDGKRYLWIPGGLTGRKSDGESFAAEATLSSFEMRRQTFYTIILRDVNERLAAEETIRSLLFEAEYLREEIDQLQNFGEIVGRSDALLQVMRDVEQVAATDASVLIHGETGTGKELIARAIHGGSERHERPLVKVNCAAIPANLMESEFFGHVKGAFTGATEPREGRFSLADGGTLFLDEIGELPLDLQVKLLRVLQEGEFEPVGSSQTRSVDVRVVAATNRDLSETVKEGTFREDLYYRINVFPIDLPPLRERDGDVALLATLFAERFAKKMGRMIEPLTDACVRRLKAYDWPGNVRELENVIERAIITSRDGRLNLDRAIPEPADLASTDPQNRTPDTATTVFTVAELQQQERANIIRALEACGGKVSGDQGAAALLGMKPSTLTSRMKALDIARSATG